MNKKPAIKSRTLGLSLCPSKTKANKACRNVAGYKTDHLGNGMCFFHENSLMLKGLSSDKDRTGFPEGGYVTANEKIVVKAAKYANDPSIFDLRKEIGALKVAVEDVVARLEVSRGDLSLVGSLRELVDTLGKAQQRAVQTLATKGFFLTIAQVEKVVRDLSSFYMEEMAILVEKHPEMAEDIMLARRGLASRVVKELELPQPPLLDDEK